MQNLLDRIYVVYDGTSYFIIAVEDFTSDLEIIGEFNNIDKAQAVADKLND